LGQHLGRIGWGGTNPQNGASYIKNKMNGMIYDNSGNLTDAAAARLSLMTLPANKRRATNRVGSSLCNSRRKKEESAKRSDLQFRRRHWSLRYPSKIPPLAGKPNRPKG